MTIITQTDDKHKSKYKPDFVAEATHAATSGTGYKRTLQYREWRNRAAACLYDAGYEAEALDFLSCAELPYFLIPSDTPELPGNTTTVWVCDHDNRHEAACYCNTCDGRYCPDCAHRQVARFASRYVPAVLACAEKRGHNRLRHIVLTTPLALTDPDCARKLTVYWNAVGRLWKRLSTCSPQWSTEGTIEAFEFGEDGHKLHFHIIHYGRYLPQSAICDAWAELTGAEAEITFVRGIGVDDDATDAAIANEVIETLKYSVKFWSKDRSGDITYINPAFMPDLLRVIKGKRRVRSRGCFYNITAVDKQPLCCAACGNEMLRVGVAFFPIWQATGFSPKEYKIALGEDKLHLILANKSVSEGEENNKSPPTQPLLWGESHLPAYRGRSHYDDAYNKKAF